MEGILPQCHTKIKQSWYKKKKQNSDLTGNRERKCDESYNNKHDKFIFFKLQSAFC